MAQKLRVLATQVNHMAFPEPIWQLTTVSNSDSRGLRPGPCGLLAAHHTSPALDGGSRDGEGEHSNMEILSEHSRAGTAIVCEQLSSL